MLFSPWLGLPGLSTSLLTLVALYGIAATGLNLMFGYGGMLSLGNGIFIGFAGYATALGTQRLHLPMLTSVLLGIAVALVVALSLGLVLVRLSGHYFAVATLGLALAFSALLVAIPGVTGGGSGLTTTPRLPLGFVTVRTNFDWYVFTALVTAAVLGVLAWAVAGKRGRILRLVRQDELAAEVLGVPVFRTKVAVFALGGALTGVAGSLLFVSQGLMDPSTVSILTSVQLLMLVVIGGQGYRLGGLVGAFVVLWLQALLNRFGDYELLVYGAILLLVVFYLRSGIEGAFVQGWQAVMGGLRGRAGSKARGTQVAATQGAPSGAGLSAGSTVHPAKLEVRSAHCNFGGIVAVEDVSIVVPPGKISALIGANGAGKSTLLNLISGVEQLESGSILLGGRDLHGLSPAERARGGVVRTFQVPRLVEELSIIENMALGHEATERPVIRRNRRAETALLARAEATLAALSLEHLSGRAASSLGTGERKYAEVARAVFTDPSVLLLDEPAVGLSVDEVDQLRAWLVSLRDAGAAILVIDHNIAFVKELADHVYSLVSGRLVWEGHPDQLDSAGPASVGAATCESQEGGWPGRAADGGSPR